MIWLMLVMVTMISNVDESEELFVRVAYRNR